MGSAAIIFTWLKLALPARLIPTQDKMNTLSQALVRVVTILVPYHWMPDVIIFKIPSWVTILTLTSKLFTKRGRRERQML